MEVLFLKNAKLNYTVNYRQNLNTVYYDNTIFGRFNGNISSISATLSLSSQSWLRILKRVPRLLEIRLPLNLPQNDVVVIVLHSDFVYTRLLHASLIQEI